MYERQEDRRNALRLWRQEWPPNPSGIIAYAERYGVWLVDEAHIQDVMEHFREAMDGNKQKAEGRTG